MAYIKAPTREKLRKGRKVKGLECLGPVIFGSGLSIKILAGAQPIIYHVAKILHPGALFNCQEA